MVSLHELVNSKEFQNAYKNASPEERKEMDRVITFARSRLQEYLNAINNELESREQQNIGDVKHE